MKFSRFPEPNFTQLRAKKAKSSLLNRGWLDIVTLRLRRTAGLLLSSSSLCQFCCWNSTSLSSTMCDTCSHKNTLSQLRSQRSTQECEGGGPPLRERLMSPLISMRGAKTCRPVDLQEPVEAPDQSELPLCHSLALTRRQTEEADGTHRAAITAKLLCCARDRA